MGRRKITIKTIADPKLRHITFNKRKNGLIKKASELSMLCNINMLLIFEDGNGSLIQFSRDKISSLSQFFKECKYSSILELSNGDYPNFFKVNHYKKTKDRDDMSDDDSDDDTPPQRINNQGKQKNARTFQQTGYEAPARDHHQPLESAGKKFTRPTRGSNKVHQDLPEPSPTNTENSGFGPKKTKNKLGLKLNIPHKEEPKPQMNDQYAKQEPSPFATKTPMLQDFNLFSAMSQSQQKDLISKLNPGGDIAQSPFLGGRDGLQSALAESPFKFVSADSKVKFMNRLNQGMLGDGDLSSMLKGTSYLWPGTGNTPLIKGDGFDDKLLDTAKINSLLNESKVFTFDGNNDKQQGLNDDELVNKFGDPKKKVKDD